MDLQIIEMYTLCVKMTIFEYIIKMMIKRLVRHLVNILRLCVIPENDNKLCRKVSLY